MDRFQNYGTLLVKDNVLRHLIFRGPRWGLNFGYYPYRAAVLGLNVEMQSLSNEPWGVRWHIRRVTGDAT